MAKKHKHPEHVNLERYLISYADFITLLFATFVVLYALSQVDIKDFKALEQSLKQAFDAPSIMQGSEGLMQTSSNEIFETSQADSMIAPLMMEYVSQKYETESMQDIKKTIDEKIQSGELNGIQATQTDRGLLIRFTDSYLFAEGSANLTPMAKEKISKIGAIISKKFFLHNLRVEGHTDNQPVKNKAYPTNWELSGARASSVIRYLIQEFKFMPCLFTAVGFADTRPLAPNDTAANQAKNRRVEILILKNKYRTQESAENKFTKMTKEVQEQIQAERINAINKVEGLSSAARNLSKGNEKAEDSTIILNQVYDKESKRISKETKVLDRETADRIKGEGNWLKPPAARKVEAFKD